MAYLLSDLSTHRPFSQESVRSFPILCTVVVPQVAIRTAVFVALHDSAAFPSGAGSDARRNIVGSQGFHLRCIGSGSMQPCYFMSKLETYDILYIDMDINGSF